MIMDCNDFFRWLTSPEGRLSEQALFEVHEALHNASVDPYERTIIWEDGSPLSIEETVRRIHAQFDLPLGPIESHVIGWLEMDYEPDGLDEPQMEQFENLIEKWIEHHSKTSSVGRETT